MGASDGVLGLSPGAARMSSVGVTTELQLVVRWNLENLFESLPNLHQSVSAAGLASSASPQANSEETLPHVHHDTHDLVITFILKRLTNRGQLSVKPKFVDIHRLLFFESVRPFPSMFVLGILPLRSYSSLEEVIVGLDSQIGTCGNIVLKVVRLTRANYLGFRKAYVDTPELFNGIKRDHLFQQVIPVITL